ncbi:MAG: hypothetical protein CBB72_011860 [Muricauda sp. TMED12]|nr:MAG: hypothetical protein CBB72_011860 [Muricauda sp. TMED12]
MLSFRTYLREAADPMLDLIKGLEFTIKDSNDRAMIVIVQGADRFSAKTELEKQLRAGNVSFKDGIKSSTSLDIRTTDATYNNKMYRFFFKPKKQGSGAGAEVTALGESFQAYACAARQALGRVLDSGEDVFDNPPKGVDADRTLEQCKTLPPEWITTGVTIANAFHNELGSGNYVFHRGSRMITQIEGEYQRLSRAEGIRLNINKWNPADIWAASSTFKFKGNHASLAQYNQYILEQFKMKQLIGVSLKKLAGTKVKKEIFNAEKSDISIRFGSHQLVAGRKDFFANSVSKDVYLQYTVDGKAMKMQLRTFSSGMSGWQGEIKGAAAAGGKVGGGNLQQSLVLAGIPASSFIDQTTFKAAARSMSDATVKSYVQMYKYLSNDKRSESEMIALAKQQLQELGASWFYSKFLSVQFTYVMIKSGRQDQVLKNIAMIAASNTDVSSVFYKYS